MDTDHQTEERHSDFIVTIVTLVSRPLSSFIKNIRCFLLQFQIGSVSENVLNQYQPENGSQRREKLY